MTEEIRARAAKIRLLLMDVDGVLTNGHLYNVPDSAGNLVETKGFGSTDGIALQWLNWHGILTGVISGRVSPATAERARQTRMKYIYQGHIEKIPILQEIMTDANIGADEIAYVGDDLTDIVCFHRVGLGIAVANARKEVKAEAHHITDAAGGEGAVREVCELLLEAKGLWGEILKKYEVGTRAGS